MTISLRLKEIKAGTPTLRAMYEKVEGDTEIINLAGGDPDFDTPIHVQQAAADAAASGKTHYAPTQGIPPLREAIAERYANRYGVGVKPSEVQVTSGAANALFLGIHSLVEPGDRVVVLEPALGFIMDSVSLAGGEVIPLWLDTESPLSILEPALERELPKAKMLIVNYPNNPTGRVLAESEVELLLKIVQKHDCLLLSDEVYDELVYDEEPRFSTFWRTGSERTIVVNSFSKTYAMTGWRLGYLIAPEPLRQLATTCFSYSVSHISTPTQYAGVAALTQDQECVGAMVDEYRARRDYLASRFSEMPALDPWYPQSGLFFFIDISATGYGSSEMCEMLLDQAKVFVFPGDRYGYLGDRFIRITFANAPLPRLQEAISRMDPFFRELK